METKIKEIHSPHPDVAKDEVLELQYAVTELKVLVVKLVLNGESLETIKSQAIDVINKCIARLGPVLGAQHVQRTLLNTFNSDYHMLSNNMKVINEHYSKKVPGYAIDPLNPDATVSDQSIRNFWTDQKRGAAVIKDYRKEVANQLKVISATAPIVALNDRDGNSYKMSARNYAEMTVRHLANLDDIASFKEEGIDLVWTSSHVDASKRCEPYQGKLYSLNRRTGTTKDGIPFTPLDDVLDGPKGDGNGIISGYNCRHYLIPYVPGSTAPIEYNKEEIAKERKINERQRIYENQIRQLKLQQKLAKESGNTELANRLSKRWHKLDLNYQAFSLDNGKQFYRWRTVIGRDEYIEPNKWGKEQAVSEERQIVKDKLNELNKLKFNEEQKTLRKELNEKIDNGSLPKVVRSVMQRKHIEGTKEYSDAVKISGHKSILTSNPDDLLKYVGTGIIKKSLDGAITETVTLDENIGFYINKDQETGELIKIPTNVIQIKYSKKGIHFIPANPKKGSGNI